MKISWKRSFERSRRWTNKIRMRRREMGS